MTWSPENDGGPEKLVARLEEMVKRMNAPVPMIPMGDGQLFDEANGLAAALRFRVEQRSEWGAAFDLAMQLRREIGRIIAIDSNSTAL